MLEMSKIPSATFVLLCRQQITSVYKNSHTL